MKKNEVFSYVMTRVLSLGSLGGTGVSVLAATDSSASAAEQRANVKASADSETQKKAIRESYSLT